MESYWQILIGAGLVGVVVSVYSLYRSYVNESEANNESQTMAKWAIIFGLSGIILVFIGSLIGIVLSLISMKKKKYKALSKLGLFFSILTTIPWILVIIFGP